MNETCACGHASYVQVEAGVSHRNIPNFAYALMQCNQCQLVRTAPVPSEETYTSGDEATQERIKNEASYRNFARSILDDVKRRQPSGRFLDIGCNIGILVDEAQKLGYEAMGIDLDPSAVAYGVSQGRQLVCGPISEMDAHQQFDVIVINHVLEHIIPIGEFLKTVERLLAPNGLLFVNVPNYAGLVPQVMKANWGALWPHQHVWQFTPDTLRALIERETSLVCLGTDTSHNLEPPSTRDLKGMVKQAAIAASVLLRRADEIRAVFKKQIHDFNPAEDPRGKAPAKK